MRDFLRLLGVALVLLAAPVHAQEPFVVGDIRTEGLQRISAGTIFNYLPIEVGDRVDSAATSDAVRALYRTGFFRDVRIERDGDVLVVVVTERPAIAEIEISGNSEISTKELQQNLRDAGLAQGQVFDRALLDRIERELEQVYYSRGRYAVKVSSTVTPLARNRVGILLEISEGLVARIRRINVVGNSRYTDDQLRDDFQLTERTWISFITKSDQYSKQKLAADLETLRAHYLDLGYLRFAINSTQVSISSDRQDVYITINLTEGEPYTVGEIALAGNLIIDEAELSKRIVLKAGTSFSRELATRSSDAITTRLGDDGYAFANVNIVPEIDDESHTVAVTFFVDPGRRAYVRRINISGNQTTSDEVIRREVRQMESAWISTSKVSRSRQRLQQLGHFEEVRVTTPAVPGTTDQVDININIVERPTGSLMAGVGYSQSEGVTFNAGITQENFLGTGRRVKAEYNNSGASTVYSFSMTNPYYTIDGVSRGFGVFFSETDAEESAISSYRTDAYGGNVTFGIPLNEYERMRLAGEYRHTTLKLGVDPTQDLQDFVPGSDTVYEFDTYSLTASWSHDTRNRAIFADRGARQTLSAEVALPGGDISYYKLSYRQQRYWPLTDALTLSVDANLAYGDGIGDTLELPPTVRYYAGGLSCVRGYYPNSVGPKDTDNGDPLGGNLRICGRAELLLPVPFGDRRNLQLALFGDFGNVYDTDDESTDLAKLRYSTGLGLTWLSPVGPLSFNYAWPFNAQPGDREQQFQFSLGATF